MLTPFSMFVSPRFAMRDRGGVERAEVEVAKEIPSLLVPLFRGKRQEIQIKRADGREYAVQELRREQVEVGRHKGDDTRLTLPLGVSTFFFFFFDVRPIRQSRCCHEREGGQNTQKLTLTDTCSVYEGSEEGGPRDGRVRASSKGASARSAKQKPGWEQLGPLLPAGHKKRALICALP